jgi:hypothetical protein
MFPPDAGIRDLLGHDLVGVQFERVSNDEIRGFSAAKLSNLNETLARLYVGGKYEGLLVSHPVNETEGSGHNVHLSITDQDVAVSRGRDAGFPAPPARIRT